MAKIVFNRLKSVFEEVGGNVVGKLQFQLQQDNINASGKTSASIKHKVFQKGSIVGVGIKSRKRLNVDVLSVIEHGREAGTAPPYRAIAKWIRDKNIPLRSSKRRPQDIARAAYGIAQAIKLAQSRGSQPPRFGVRPKNVFNKAVGTYRSVMAEKIVEAFGQDVRAVVDAKLNKDTKRTK